ncbi:hypothetical protein ACMHYB_45730 [Sorangium sp. So ce1128]
MATSNLVTGMFRSNTAADNAVQMLHNVGYPQRDIDRESCGSSPVIVRQDGRTGTLVRRFARASILGLSIAVLGGFGAACVHQEPETPNTTDEPSTSQGANVEMHPDDGTIVDLGEETPESDAVSPKNEVEPPAEDAVEVSVPQPNGVNCTVKLYRPTTKNGPIRGSVRAYNCGGHSLKIVLTVRRGPDWNWAGVKSLEVNGRDGSHPYTVKACKKGTQTYRMSVSIGPEGINKDGPKSGRLTC